MNQIQGSNVAEFKRQEVEAPEGMDFVLAAERLAHRALIENGKLHQQAIDRIIDLMGSATIMRFPDGSYYAREVIQRGAITIKPEPYSSIVYHDAE